MNLISISAFQDNYIWVLVDDDRRCIIVDPANPHRSCTRLKKTAGSRRRSSLPITITIMSAVFPISLHAIPIYPSTDQQRHRIRVRRKLLKKAKVSSSSGGSFPYLLRQSHFRSSLFLQQTLSVLWRHAVFWRLWKAV